MKVYICEIAPLPLAELTTPRPSPPTCPPQPPCNCPTPAPRCEPGWTYIVQTRKCHKILQNEMSWLDSLATCRNLGGTLTSIHSDDANYFLVEFAAQFRTGVWYQIGLYRPTDNAQYVWTDGSAVEYTGWYSDWPFDTPKYDCAVLRVDPSDPANKKWVNWYCDNESFLWYGLCEKEAR